MTRSTTRRRLHRLRAALLAVTALVLLSSWYAFDDVHDTIATVRNDTTPALLEAAAARFALAEADQLAINSFGTGEAHLTGPGDRYQNRIAMANQSLAQVAENNTAGDAASRQLHLVAGLLVAYTGSIEQADAHYRQGASTLATTDLWYASRLLHGGILSQLDQVVVAQGKALDGQLAASSTSFWRVVLLAVPIVVLGWLLVRAQLFLRQRFNRAWNAYLLAASVLLAGLAVVTGLGVRAQSQVEAAAGELRQVTASWETKTSAARVDGQTELKDLVTAQCASSDGGCGDTVTRFITELRAAGSADRVTDQQLTASAKRVNGFVTEADSRAGLEVLVPVLSGLIMVLVLLGFLPRVEEYRFEKR